MTIVDDSALAVSDDEIETPPSAVPEGEIAPAAMSAYAEDWDKKAKLELGTFEFVSASIDKPFINIRSGTMTTTIDKAKVAT